ncbi:GNAT family N-acetyltransferase [Phyllobacterium sp. OV277]|uniref:GNAT family N-acetyltransferase n=1 Tax=Phyllobacterium sp. OV277 TaxID=1882772 RepID=UPI000881315A|nr:GNAT family N-acetyltransferase [Phyllobacterium sp. OV277]SDO49598.1 Acetyltransferase (GNAT) family protein [Phyllobacterium sp. OV277]
MTFHIRTAKADDALNLAALSTQVWLHTYAKAGLRNTLSRYVFAAFTEKKLAAEIANGAKQLLVCEVDACLVGYAKIAYRAICPVRRLESVEIETLYVQEHFSGHGVGSALLQAAMDHSRAKGWNEVFLMVNLENHRARTFYETRAFERIGTVDFALEDERHANAVLIKYL